jgi:hypothetical protein
MDPKQWEPLMFWCKSCNDYKFWDEFNSKSKRRKIYCDACNKKYNQKSYKARSVNMKARKKRQYAENPNKFKEKNKRDYDKNRDKILTNKKVYYRENAAAIIAKFTENYNNDLNFRLKHVIRRRTRDFISNKEIKYQEMIGCSHDELTAWFEFNFELDSDKNMDWTNYGTLWQIDHVYPLSKAKDAPDEAFCYSWKNLRPIPSSENSSKSNIIDQIAIVEQQTRVENFIKMRNVVSVTFPKDTTEFESTAGLEQSGTSASSVMA